MPVTAVAPQDKEQGAMELYLVVFFTLVFPPILLFGFFVVQSREEIVVLRFGKYVATLKTQTSSTRARRSSTGRCRLCETPSSS